MLFIVFIVGLQLLFFSFLRSQRGDAGQAQGIHDAGQCVLVRGRVEECIASYAFIWSICLCVHLCFSTQTGVMLSKPNQGGDDKPMTTQVSTNRPYKVFRQSNLIPLILTFHHCDYLAIDSAACHQSVMNRTRSFTLTVWSDQEYVFLVLTWSREKNLP